MHSCFDQWAMQMVLIINHHVILIIRQWYFVPNVHKYTFTLNSFTCKYGVWYSVLKIPQALEFSTQFASFKYSSVKCCTDAVLSIWYWDKAFEACKGNFNACNALIIEWIMRGFMSEILFSLLLEPTLPFLISHDWLSCIRPSFSIRQFSLLQW